VLRSELVVQPVVHVYLVEAVAVRERSARDVHRRLHAVVVGHRVVSGREDDAVARISDQSGYLGEIGGL